MSTKTNRVQVRLMAVVFCVAVAMPAFCLQQAQNSSAWKPEQHIPVGGMVLDDLFADSTNTLTIDGIDYTANGLVCGAIRSYPEYYQMGCIGPDVYPDILYGQCFIHPDNRDLLRGSPNGGSMSYSYQWIDLLLKHAIDTYYAGDVVTSMKALAYTYGFMTHYAGDMFGHTYINELSGGPWDTVRRGWDNALRHMAIENFIYKTTNGEWSPWFLNQSPFVHGGAGPFAFAGDTLFNSFMLDVFYRDPVAQSMIPTRNDDKTGWWGDFWKVMIDLEENVDDYIAEFDKPIDERAWWAQPSPVSQLIEQYFIDWKELIEEGLLAWVETNSKIAIDLFVIQSADYAMADLRSWVDLYLKNMTMGPLVQAITDFARGMQNWFDILQVGLTGGVSLAWDYCIDWVKDQTTQALAKFILEKWTGHSWEDYKLLIENPLHWIVADDHQSLWTVEDGAPHSGQETLEIILADLNNSWIDAGTFDPMRFAPAYNSVVMAKLVLLDGHELNMLLHNYGVPDKYLDVSPTEMKDLSLPRSNIMFGQMKSLDADHQWMKTAPDPFVPEDGAASWGEGMPIWENKDAREKMFKKIFHMGTEVVFDRLKVATEWGVDTPVSLNITNTGNRDEEFVVSVRTEGFGSFSGYPTENVFIGAGETVPYTVHFVCDLISGRDYAGGKLTVKVVPVSAGDDPDCLYGNEASCIVVAFPFENPTFWLDLDYPFVLNYNDSEVNPSIQPYNGNLQLGPRTFFDRANGTVKPFTYRAEADAYISSRTPMRLYGFSEEGGSFTSMSVQYESTPHYHWGDHKFTPCPNYKQSPWVDLKVTDVNYVDVGWEHLRTIIKVPRVYTSVCKFSTINNPNYYYFNFDPTMAALNVTGSIEWTDDIYTIRYSGTTELGLTYTDYFTVYLDNTPPKTTVRIDKADDLSSGTFLLYPDSQITFSAYDRGSGVDSTFYKIVRNMTVIDNARNMAFDSTTVVPWTTYTGAFNLTDLVRSGHSGDVYYLTWYSFDRVANQEAKNTLKFTLVYDEIAPRTILRVGTPSESAVMKGARAFVTHETLLTLTASDANEPLDPDLTGVLTTRYRIVNDGYDSGWLAYGAPFALSTVPDGFYSVDYASTDKNLNSEPAKRAEFILDTTSPSTDIELTGPSKTVQAGCYIEPSTSFSLSAVDIGSGVDSTEYRISGSGEDTGWQPYAGSFSLSEYSTGEYLLEYRSADIMANSEQTRSMQLSLVMDDMLPPSAYCVSGFVRDQNTSDPIEGATVRFGDISCVTDETGSYSFLVTNGTHVFDVSADGYDVRSVTVIVSGDDVVRDIGLDVAGNGGSKANSVSVPTAGAIILAVAVVAAILSFLALSRLGVGRRPDGPPPPES